MSRGSPDLCDLSASELGARLAAGEITCAELAESSLRRIEAVEPRLGAFLTRTPELARERAVELDAYLAAGGPRTSASGIPTALKDVLTTRGVRTTCGSRILADYVPPYDATAWARLSGAGAVLVGKTNCDEFAMGSSNEHSAFGPVRNPWDLERVPGGSSGGSAAAVAAGEAVWALGTDTGGSVRQPAALCGIVGLKPTYGRVSRYGLIAFASSLDTVGCFTRSVRDAALLLRAIAGHDARDATSLDAPVEHPGRDLEAGVAGMRIGLVAGALEEGVEPGVREAVRTALDRLAALGAELEEVALPHAEHALSAYYLIAPSEASSNLARYDGVRYGVRAAGEHTDVAEMMARTRGRGFGPEVKRRVILGTYALSAGYYEAYYGQAQRVRTLIIRDYEAAFERVDVLVSPTSPTTAFRLGERLDDPLAMYLSDIFTIPANLAGVPAVSVPCGFADGLPVGLQITGPPLAEARILRAASALEADLGLDLRPPLLASL
ncbi:MAG: glutamyl-tRNA(Gln) amidotransferase subunit A [Actinomycetota bacterium]|nr:MAG: glutamyl-tRNA(Gln) amidotransferase subunit A [Actinomycetota bacterium]